MDKQKIVDFVERCSRDANGYGYYLMTISNLAELPPNFSMLLSDSQGSVISREVKVQNFSAATFNVDQGTVLSLNGRIDVKSRREGLACLASLTGQNTSISNILCMSGLNPIFDKPVDFVFFTIQIKCEPIFGGFDDGNSSFLKVVDACISVSNIDVMLDAGSTTVKFSAKERVGDSITFYRNGRYFVKHLNGVEDCMLDQEEKQITTDFLERVKFFHPEKTLLVDNGYLIGKIPTQPFIRLRRTL